MYLYVPAPRSATDRSTWTLNRAPKSGHHLIAQTIDPRAGERAFQARDPASLQVFQMSSDQLCHWAVSASNAASRLASSCSGRERTGLSLPSIAHVTSERVL